ncbi:hypothetical protein [Henriciella mobilis]|uniref:hypothetical protein n=1 Tax=Henriciella mobilis TaxID=2305467 RepID=UPI0011C41D6C|nr:hypothetical protein [Henriciella mobilis]
MPRNPTFESRSAQTILAHADLRLRELETAEKVFNERCPYRLFTERDFDTGHILFKAKIIESPPLSMVPIAFDVLGALRSSLDHVVYDASKRLGGKPRPKYTKFPFGKTKGGAKNDLGRKRSEVPAALHPYLLSFKPYMRGNKTLWALNEFRNHKIHRTLGLLAMATTTFAINTGRIGVLHFDQVSEWDGRKRELTYLRATRVEDVNVEMQVSLNVTFQEIPSLKREPAIRLLRKMLADCQKIVSGVESKTVDLLRA